MSGESCGRNAAVPLKDRHVLLPIIKTADKQGTAMLIEPGLNAVTHVDWPVDLGVLIIRNTYFSSLGIQDYVCGPFQRLHVADDRYGRRIPRELRQTLLFAQRA